MSLPPVVCGRQGFGDLVSDGEVVSHDAGGVLQRLLGFDGAVDHALRDLVSPVLVSDIVKHATAAVRIEIDVDIRQRHTFRVKESFEDQARA